MLPDPAKRWTLAPDLHVRLRPAPRSSRSGPSRSAPRRRCGCPTRASCCSTRSARPCSHAQNLPGDLVDQETAVRGFVIGGGDAAFLIPTNRARAAEDRDVAAIRGYLASRDDPRSPRTSPRWRRPPTPGGPSRAAAARPRPTAPRPRPGQGALRRRPGAIDRLQADLDAERTAAARRARDAARPRLVVRRGRGRRDDRGLPARPLVGLRRWCCGRVAGLAAQVRLVASGDGPPGGGRRPAGDRRPRRRRRRDARARSLDELERSARRATDGSSTSQAAGAGAVQPRPRAVRLRGARTTCRSRCARSPASASCCSAATRGKLDERADQYIAFAVDGAKRMQQLINDLLSFSRVGRTTAAFTEVALDDVVARGAGHSSSRATRTSDADDRARAAADGARRRVAAAARCSATYRQRAEVPRRRAARRASWSAPSAIGDEWEITVADNGIGIDPEYADKVFVIFQRLHAADVYAGTGIGLAMCEEDRRVPRRPHLASTRRRPEPGTTLRLHAARPSRRPEYR